MVNIFERKLLEGGKLQVVYFMSNKTDFGIYFSTHVDGHWVASSLQWLQIKL